MTTTVRAHGSEPTFLPAPTSPRPAEARPSRATRRAIGWIGIGAAAFAVLSLAPATASADTLEARTPDTNGIRAVGKGVKEIGFESLLVLNYRKEGSVSSLRTSNLTGLTFRYFVAKNFNLTLNGSYFYKGDDIAARQGGVFTVGGNFLFNLVAPGLFLDAGLAVGGFIGQESAPKGSPDGTKGPKLMGGSARAGFGLVFYANPRFNLFARPEAIFYLGQSTLGTATTSLLNIDGGFNVGASFVF